MESYWYPILQCVLEPCRLFYKNKKLPQEKPQEYKAINYNIAGGFTNIDSLQQSSHGRNYIHEMLLTIIYPKKR